MGLLVAGLSASADIDSIEPLFKQYCHGCHGADTRQGGINLEHLTSQRPLVKNRRSWDKVIAILEIGRMPPEGAPQPSPEQRTEIVDTLDALINGFDYSGVNHPGPKGRSPSLPTQHSS